MFEMRLSSHSLVPPGGWRYKHPISGFEMERHVWDLLLDDVRAHCAANGYPPISDEEIEQQMCERIGGDAKRFCSGDGVSVAGVNLHWRDIWNGTKVLGSLILGGRQLVSRDEAERRADICAPCSRNVIYNKPCGGDCPELEQAVVAIVGSEGTTRDSELNACSVCHCSAKAHVWVPIEHLKRGVTAEMMKEFPNFCWKAAGIRELDGENH